MDLTKNGRFFEAETIKSRTMARSQSAGVLFGSYNELSGNSNAGGIHTFDVVKAKHRSARRRSRLDALVRLSYDRTGIVPRSMSL